ncbi:hypothetical protein HKX48_000835, partial [Thoreauomyces humboldtii]
RAGCGQTRTVVDALVRTILSQNTTDVNSTRAWTQLHDTYGAGKGGDVDMFDRIRTADVRDVADAIRCGGLANVKSRVIVNALNSIHGKHGECSLEHLHDVGDDRECMRQLMDLDGVGPKTASCVLLFCLRRESFAVDTHVFRLSKALGWLPGGNVKANVKVTRETAQQHLDLRIPGHLKYPLHVLLVRHGKECDRCSANGRATGGRPGRKKGQCPLLDVRLGDPSSSSSSSPDDDVDKDVKEDDEATYQVDRTGLEETVGHVKDELREELVKEELIREEGVEMDVDAGVKLQVQV